METYYWDAFQRLSTERSIGMGIGSIPYSAIRSYADEEGIVSRDEFDYFYGVIHVMDAEYISMANSTDKSKPDMVPISDVEGQHAMFSRLKARAGADPRFAGKKR